MIILKNQVDRYHIRHCFNKVLFSKFRLTCKYAVERNKFDVSLSEPSAHFWVMTFFRGWPEVTYKIRRQMFDEKPTNISNNSFPFLLLYYYHYYYYYYYYHWNIRVLYLTEMERPDVSIFFPLLLRSLKWKWRHLWSWLIQIWCTLSVVQQTVGHSSCTSMTDCYLTRPIADYSSLIGDQSAPCSPLIQRNRRRSTSLSSFELIGFT